MRRRSRFHRVTAVLSSALLLQLSLLAGGTLCPMHMGQIMAMGDGQPHTMAHTMSPATTQSRHHEAAMHHASSEAGSATQAASVAPGVPGQTCGSGSCDMPWTPGTCTSAGGCAIGTAAIMTARMSDAGAASTLVAPARAAALPLGPTLNPELPPPRI